MDKIYAFIDSQNLNLSILNLGWKLDFRRFRVYLREKYHVQNAYLFIGYIPENAELYKNLQEMDYICVFRPVLTGTGGKTKGNVDAELVLHTMIEFPHYDKAILVSGDGDFQCLAKYLHEQGKLAALLIPNQAQYSALLKFKIFKPYLRFVSDLKTKLETRPVKKKSPRED
jgi:uncharacterized LabA/DUF88 family protein